MGLKDRTYVHSAVAFGNGSMRPQCLLQLGIVASADLQFRRGRDCRRPCSSLDGANRCSRTNGAFATAALGRRVSSVPVRTSRFQAVTAGTLAC